MLGIPCITLRNNTERPETLTLGTNELIGENVEKLQEAFRKIERRQWKSGNIPPLWDGHAATRIVDILENLATEYAEVIAIEIAQ